MKKKIVFFALILLVIFPAACRNNTEEARFMISQEKLTHAMQFRFTFRFVKDGEPVIMISSDAFSIVAPTGRNFNPFYTELEFVRTFEEAEGFADNVAVAWPRRLWIESTIDGMHEVVNRDPPPLNELSEYEEVITLENFGLSYPITFDDFIDNWESVLNLWLSLPVEDMNAILQRAVDAVGSTSPGIAIDANTP